MGWWPFVFWFFFLLNGDTEVKHGKDTKQHAGSDRSRQEETRDTCPPALIPQIHLHCYDGLQPTEQSSQSKGHRCAYIVQLLIISELQKGTPI